MHIEGRYPFKGDAKLNAKSIIASSIGLEEGGVEIRIDDLHHMSMWIIIRLSKEEVLGLLKLSEGDEVGIIPTDSPVNLFADRIEIE